MQNLMHNTPKLAWFIVIIITFATLGYRMYEAATFPYYEDEVLSINAAKGFNESGLKVLYGDKLYRWNILAHYLLALAIRFGGVTERSTRAVSVIASAILLPLVFVMGCKLRNLWVGLLATVLLAVLSFEHQFALSARYYSLLQLFFTLCAFCFYRGFVEGRSGYKIVTILSFLLALLSHSIALELLPASLTFLFFLYGWRWLKDKYAIASVIVALLAVYFVIFFKLPHQASVSSLYPPVGVTLSKIPWSRGDALSFIKMLDQKPMHGVTLVILGLLYLLVGKETQFGFYQLIFWTGLIGVSLVSHHSHAGRYIYNLYPLHILILSYVLVRSGEAGLKWYQERLPSELKTWPRIYVWKAAIVVGLGALMFVGTTFSKQIGFSACRPPDIKPAHLYIKQYARDGEIIATSNLWLTEFYLRKPDYFLRGDSKALTGIRGGNIYSDNYKGVPYINCVSKLQNLMAQNRKGIWIIADNKLHLNTGNELISYIKKKFHVYYSSRKSKVDVYYWSPQFGLK